MPVLTVLPAGHSVDVRTDETIVDALGRAGWRSRYSCRRGGCGVCKALVIEGQVRHTFPVAGDVLTADEISAGLCLPCRATPVTDTTVALGSGPLRPILASTATPEPTHHTTIEEKGR